MSKIVIEFPSEACRDEFADWLTNIGEQYMWVSGREQLDTITINEANNEYITFLRDPEVVGFNDD